MATLFIYAHNGEESNDAPANLPEKSLVLKQDATEVPIASITQQHLGLDPKLYVYTPAENSIENVEVYYILRKFLSKSVDRVYHKLQEKSALLTQYNLAVDAIAKELDGIIAEVRYSN